MDKKKKRWLQFSGDGLFDWDKEQIKVPHKGQISTDSFRSDFSDWEDCEVEVPHTTGPLNFRFTVFVQHFDKNTNVVDMTKLKVGVR